MAFQVSLSIVITIETRKVKDKKVSKNFGRPKVNKSGVFWGSYTSLPRHRRSRPHAGWHCLLSTIPEIVPCGGAGWHCRPSQSRLPPTCISRTLIFQGKKVPLDNPLEIGNLSHWDGFQVLLSLCLLRGPRSLWPFSLAGRLLMVMLRACLSVLTLRRRSISEKSNDRCCRRNFVVTLSTCCRWDVHLSTGSICNLSGKRWLHNHYQCPPAK